MQNRVPKQRNVPPFVLPGKESDIIQVDDDGFRRVAGSKLLLTVGEAGDLLGVGRTLMYQLIRTGAVTSVRVGRLRRIRHGDLEAYAATLRPESSSSSSGTSSAA